jgi:hypothetical protein
LPRAKALSGRVYATANTLVLGEATSHLGICHVRRANTAIQVMHMTQFVIAHGQQTFPARQRSFSSMREQPN